jgi:hypothetical protein
MAAATLAADFLNDPDAFDPAEPCEGAAKRYLVNALMKIAND